MKYYHLSHTWKGKTLTINPVSQTRTPGEPETARICVCPSIAQCLTAIGDYSCYGSYDVYACEVDEVVRPVGVFDAHLTGEQWLLAPTTFVKVGTVTTDTLPDSSNLCGRGSNRVLLKRIEKRISVLRSLLH